MADRNSDNTRDRRPRWATQPGDHDSRYGHQHEQFESGNNGHNYAAGQMGDPGWRTEANSYYGAEHGARGNTDRSAERYRADGSSPRQQPGGQYDSLQNQADQPADFDAIGYRSQGRSYGGYTGDTFGGREFSGASSTWRGGSTPYRQGHANTYGPDHDRGFLRRAGDEVASWFGDEDAARRREADHSGRGPGNYTRSDQRILEDACDRITDDWSVDGTGIEVTVDNGEVTLDGTVPSRDQKRHAEDCVDAISGVKHVQNNLRVDAGNAASDATVAKPAPFI